MKSGLDVTLLALNYSPEPTGNAPYTTALARRLVDDANVTAVTGFPHYPQWSRYEEYPGLWKRANDHGVDLRRVAHWIPNPPRGLKRLLSELHFGFHQMNVPWGRTDAAVLVSPALFASALCAVRLRFPRRIPHAVWVQDLYTHGMMETGEGSRAAVRIAKTVERWLLKDADAVVAIHPAMRERMIRDLGADPERTYVIRNWGHVAPSVSHKNDARARLGWEADARIVLHSGNMGRKQGLSTVVEAARIADQRGDDVTFVLLGDGAERAELEALADGVPTLRFIDPLPDELFSDALAAADILLVNELPGVKEMAAPSKLTSYFAADRPVLAAVDPEGIVAGILAEAGGGRVTGSGDPHALLDGALDYLVHPDEMAAAAAAGSAYWRSHLSEDAAITAWREVLATVTERKHQPTTL
ncbi:glycosyltransferase family 4 protein [Demequina sp. SYSU T00039-1]|uniref:glycosyltransferase family 4 protein n=1 Tax=Demequina lignilytica TaxID=3051663 RepID=UPI0026259F4C|nr:glycosyltransferase family 4 protein [Demequina sp. SYSU T00039-1]MDN4477437.1 glycosyltransferase family 4 protein [Demequina sp. SYSU T00039-1]